MEVVLLMWVLAVGWWVPEAARKLRTPSKDWWGVGMFLWFAAWIVTVAWLIVLVAIRLRG